MDIVNAIPFYAIISIHWPAHFKQETPDTFLPMGMQVTETRTLAHNSSSSSTYL